MTINRRRFISIAAAGTASALASLASPATASPAVAWRGVALGARANISIDGDPAHVRPFISGLVDEIRRLENLFSLNRTDSAISMLNRNGRLDHPDPDFLALLSIADRIATVTGGKFDPTVQSIWRALAEEQFSGSRTMAQACVVGWGGVTFSGRQVAFLKPGMAITLNGIAQGFITDRIAEMLTAAGFDHLLVEMGEWRTVGTQRDDTAWEVIIPVQGSDQRLLLASGRALAVSHSKGTTFDRQGRFGHIVDPATGLAMERERLVAIESGSAAIADGLSTALCLVRSEVAESLIRKFPGTELVIDTDSI
jgi:FAD:protein FMN transferase